MSYVYAIETRDLTHRYGARIALDALTFAVEAGECFALLGPNGGGKTTLFRILCTLIAPTSGAAEVFGLDVVRRRADVRRRIGVAFQSPSLDRKLTAAENLKHAGRLYGLRGTELRQRIGEKLALLGAADRADERVEKLSGGLARRVELAKALLHEPELLLLDEPAAGLDVTARRDLWDHLRRLAAARGTTVLMTTHILEDAEAADRVGILDRGRLVALDAPAVLKRRIGGSCVTIWCDSPDELAAAVHRRYGVEATLIDSAVRIEHPDGHRFAAEMAAAFSERIRSVTVSQPTLADVFIHLTGHRLSDQPDAAEAWPA